MGEPSSLPSVASGSRIVAEAVSSLRRFAQRGAWWALVVGTVCFRLPDLKNAAAINSDASIVGLQAMHILRGQWSPWLQGSPYQTSTDAAVAAVYFAIFGASPVVLMISTLTSYLLLLWLAFSMLARLVGNARAAILCSLLVFTTCVVEMYAVHPPRQSALTFAFLSAWIVSADHRIPSSHQRMGLGGFVGALSVFADPYAVVFVAPLMIFSASVAFGAEASWRGRGILGGIYLMAFVVGCVPLRVLWAHGGPPTQVGISLAGASVRARLLYKTCLPILLGFRIPAPFAPKAVGSFAVHVVGALALLAGFVSACAAPFLSAPKPARRLALLALATSATTLLGFVLSPCAVDQLSHRYLVGVSLMLPFVFAPIACVLDWKRLALLVLPITLSFGTAGWAAYGWLVSGVHIQAQAAVVEADERRVEAFLSDHGVRYAMANYWEAYTMTFLYHEDIVVVPREPWLDRTPTERARVMASERIGYIVNRTLPWDSMAMTEFWLNSLGTLVDRVDVGRYTVLVFKRTEQHSVARSNAPPTGATAAHL